MIKLFNKSLPIFLTLIIISIISGCGKGNIITDNNLLPENNLYTNQNIQNDNSISGSLYVSTSFITSLGSITQSTSNNNNPYALTNATITLKDIINPYIDITKQITGKDSFKTDSNGNFIIPVLVSDTPIILEASIGSYRFIAVIPSVTSNIYLSINNKTTVYNCIALQTGYDSIMNIKFANIDNLYKQEFASNICELKNALVTKSDFTDFDKFIANSAIELIRSISESNINNIEAKDSVLNLVKDKIILTGCTIIDNNKSSISSDLSWKPVYLTKIFETNFNDPLNKELPINTNLDNIILKYGYDTESVQNNQEYSGSGSESGYSGSGYYSGSGNDISLNQNEYYSNTLVDTLNIIYASCLYPASGSGYIQWETSYSGNNEYNIYLCDTATPNIVNNTIENPISSQNITAEAGEHTTNYEELLQNIRKVRIKSANSLYIFICKTNTDVCSNGYLIEYADISYNAPRETTQQTTNGKFYDYTETYMTDETTTTSTTLSQEQYYLQY